MGEPMVWLGMRAGSDERVECVCTRKLLDQAPVGAHQSEVITVGMLSGWEKVEVEEGGMGMAMHYGLWQWKYF